MSPILVSKSFALQIKTIECNQQFERIDIDVQKEINEIKTKLKQTE